MAYGLQVNLQGKNKECLVGATLPGEGKARARAERDTAHSSTGAARGSGAPQELVSPITPTPNTPTPSTPAPLHPSTPPPHPPPAPPPQPLDATDFVPQHVSTPQKIQ
ncbi:unnamed protein product [Gadus morhua 'NCC']